MPTWVVPSIAADLWRVSVEHVLAKARDGAVPSKTEGGFTFVDIDPFGASPLPKPAAKCDRPSTFRQVTPAELQALHNGDADHPSTAEPSATWERTHWRDARTIVQRTRVAPRPPNTA